MIDAYDQSPQRSAKLIEIQRLTENLIIFFPDINLSEAVAHPFYVITYVGLLFCHHVNLFICGRSHWLLEAFSEIHCVHSSGYWVTQKHIMMVMTAN